MKTRFSMDYFIIAYVVLFFKDFSSNKKSVTGYHNFSKH